MGWRVTLLGLGAALVLASLAGVVQYLRIQGLARSATQRLAQLQEALTSPSLAFPGEGLTALRQDLAAAEEDLAALKAEAERFGPLVPRFAAGADELRAAPPVLEVGLEVVRATRRTLEGLEPLAETLARRRSGLVSLSTLDAEMASALEAGAPRFIQAREGLARAQSIDARTLPPRLAAALKDLDVAAPRLEASLKLALAGPALARRLLGLERPRTFLVLAQNTQELRPTGGFLSGVWLMTVDRGRVTQLTFFNSPDVDGHLLQFPEPPRSLVITQWGGIWPFRESNWVPDFPTAARYAREAFRRGQGEQVDDVIAVDEVAVRNLVEALGSVTLQYTGERITASNVLEKLEYGMSLRYWSPPESPTLPPKKVLMKSLLESILLRLDQGVSLLEGGKAVLSVLQGLEEKHILLDAGEPSLKSQLRAYQWDGAVVQGEGDYLLVTDTNVGFDKMNASVTQALDYGVSIGEDGRVTARLTVPYPNPSRKPVTTCQQQLTLVSDIREWKEGCYWDLLRVYVPEGSKLLGTSFLPFPEGSLVARFGPELASTWSVVGDVAWGRQEFSHFFVVRPGQTRAVRFEYVLPEGTLQRQGDQWHYSLFVQKQPGTRSIPLVFTILAPPSMIAKVTAPYSNPAAGDSVRITAALSTDRQFQVTIARR